MAVEVRYPESNPVAEAVAKLREELRINGFVFGCLFMAELHEDGVNFGLFFAEGLPPTARKSLLEDLQTALDEAKKL